MGKIESQNGLPIKFISHCTDVLCTSKTLAKYIRKYNETKVNKAITILSLLLLCLNTLVYAYINVKQLETFSQISKDIKEMKNTKDLKLKLTGMHDLYGYYYTLNDNGVNYTIKEDITTENMRYKYSWRIGVETNEKVH